MAETDNKLLNGEGLSHLSSKIKEYVSEQEEVYIGTTEPTGDEKIWINPSGEESPIVTKDYVDGEIERVEGEIPSLDGYATEEYVDDAVSEKSAVSVSDTGTATDEVQYITIDGVEKKLAGGGGSSYTFTNGLTETDGTVSWDLNDRLSGGTDVWGVNKLVFNGNTFVFGLPNAGQNTPAELRNNYSYSSGESIYLATSRKNAQACQVVLNAPNSGNPSFFPYNFGSNKLNLGQSGYKWNNGYFAGDVLANNIPAPPSTDGEYNLHCSIVNGVPTYTWKAEV